MSVDWGQAMLAGIGAGANAYGQQAMQQQAAQDEDARWLEKQKQLLAMDTQSKQSWQRYLLALSPPQTDQLKTTGKDGSPVVQTREWVPPSDEDIAAGRPGAHRTIGETPDINFEKLEETQRNNEERNRLSSERLAMQGQYNEARIDAARARLEAQQAGAAARGETKGQLIPRIDRDGNSVWGTVKDGQFIPVRDEMGGQLRSQAWRPRQGGDVDDDGEVEFVDPADFREQQPLGQFDAAPARASTPPQSAAPKEAAAAPGTSPANPIDYQPGMPKPPSGTYVRKPDGSVVRVP